MENIINFVTFFTDTTLTVLLLFSGIYFSFKTRFVQIRCFGESMKNTFGGLFRKEKSDKISPFAALATSLGAQLGTGNIVGAASAILTGGPGSVLWMWISAFFGMATAYKEAVFAQNTKSVTSSGAVKGGAVYYIEQAFCEKSGKLLSNFFALFSTLALGFTGCAVQSNSISEAMNEGLFVPKVLCGFFLCTVCFLVISKGTASIVKISEKFVPLMAFLYMASCFAVILKNIAFFPNTLKLIFTCAFSEKALLGAGLGISLKKVISDGIKRGLFTNEAGMGTSPSAHALSDSPTPHFQGTLGMAGVFIDTFVVLSFTAFAVISSLYKDGYSPENLISGSMGVTSAFSDVFGQNGAAGFVAVSILFFAFFSIVGWNLFGKTSCLYLFGDKSEKIYMFSSLFFVFIGCIVPSEFVWRLTDFFNALMVLINVPSLLMFARLEKKKDIC